MKIDMNKDFEQEFKSTLWKGFGGREILTGVLSLAAAGAAAAGAWHITGLPINVCVYFGIPFMVPIAAAGVITYQGATAGQLLKEYRYYSRTRTLTYEAGEHGGKPHAFTMKSRTGKKKGVK